MADRTPETGAPPNDPRRIARPWVTVGERAPTLDGQRRPLHPEVVPLRCWLLARDHLFAGDARQALVTAEASVATATPTMRAVSDFLVLQCRWASGLPNSRAHVLDVLISTTRTASRRGRGAPKRFRGCPPAAVRGCRRVFCPWFEIFWR